MLRRTRLLVLMLIAGLLTACVPNSSQVRSGPSLNQHALLAEVFVTGQAADGGDQYLRIQNPLQSPIDLAGWSIGDGAARAVFPPGSQIGGRQGVYVGRTGQGFRKVMGAPPDFIWGPPDAGGDRALSGGQNLTFGRKQGQVVLLDKSGAVVDQLVYGTGAAGGGAAASPGQAAGWRGAAVSAPQAGEVMDRGRDESTWTQEAPGLYVSDTDTAADWKQGNRWVDERIYRSGQTWFGSPTYQASAVTAYASPDNSYEVVSSLVDRARERIDLTLYDFTLEPVAQKLAAAARRGVRVRLLLEAGTVGQMYDQERYIAQLVAEAGGEVRWMFNDPGRGIPGRYVYNHAKYGVIDGATTFLQSENMVRHGVPTNPTFGNRGWGAVVEDRSLAAYLSRVFEADWSPAYGDVLPFKAGTPLGGPAAGFVPETEELTGSYPHPFMPLVVRSPVAVTPVLAPDHSLLETRGVIGLMRSARNSLWIEEQYIHTHWGPSNSGSTRTTPDIFLEEAIAVARRGVEVRILLGDAYLDPKDPKDNTATIKYVNETAAREGLNMQARLIKSDLSGLDKVHNKGLIVDQSKVLISSINWSYNSPANNREAGLLLENAAIGAYFADIFAFDWYDGTPADYPLITEANPTTGFVEISNAGPAQVDLGGWTLAASAGTWTLPSGTRLAPGKVLVVARDPAALRIRTAGAAPIVLQLPVSLDGNRDTVTLRRGDRAVDSVSWAESRPGWKLPSPISGSLCREAAGKDTNTYLDWGSGRASTPGVAGCG